MSSLFRKEAVEHQKDHLMGDVLLLQPLPLALLTALVAIVTILIISLLLWGSYARKEPVRGFLVPERGIVKIYPPSAGTLSKIHIKEKQKVKEGQVLFTLLAERQMESGKDVDSMLLQEIEHEEQELQKRKETEKTLQIAEQKRLAEQITGLENELKRIAEELSLHEERLNLSENRVASAKKLVEAKHLARADLDKIYEEHLSLRQHHQELYRTQVTKQNNLLEISAQLEQLPLQVQSRLSDIEKAVSDLKQRRFEIEGRRVFEIRSPIAGIADALQAYEGQWLNNMQPSHLLAILPDDSKLFAELYVPTRAVGFIQMGQEVKIRYDAFPYQRYGVYSGRIESISAHILNPNELPIPLDIKEPVYRVVVSIDKQFILAYGKEVPLQAGMSIEADVILEKQTLLQWILDPLYSLKGRV